MLRGCHVLFLLFPLPQSGPCVQVVLPCSVLSDHLLFVMSFPCSLLVFVSVEFFLPSHFVALWTFIIRFVITLTSCFTSCFCSCIWVDLRTETWNVNFSPLTFIITYIPLYLGTTMLLMLNI